MTKAEPHGATRRLEPEPVDLPCDERRLAGRFAAGDREAVAEVVARYEARITRLVRRLLRWQDDVGDVVQDVFVAALDARASFRGESRLESWLVRIAVNRCRAHHRRQWLRRDLFAAWRDQRTIDAEGSADAAAITVERTAAVRKAVDQLPTKYREVVVLYYLEEMTAQEAANVLGLKRNTVEVRLGRARKMLAQSLAALDE